jgi:peptidoglycan-associated lipoprotein
MRTTFWATLLAGIIAVGSPLARAQDKPSGAAGWQLASIDFAVTYNTARTSVTPGGANPFWLQGGSADAAFNFFHGLGLAANFTGDHASNIAPGVNFGELLIMGGPRYTLRAGSKHQSRVFVESLFGGAHGFDSVFPASASVAATANSFALQVGGGWDIAITKHCAIRAFEADYIRTGLPNNSANNQNYLRLAFGVTYRLQKH